MQRLLFRIDTPSHSASECEFTERGGHIGRGMDCTWVLECPDRLVSRRHAEVLFEQGGFWLMDTSANGVFHNGSTVPIGKDNRVAIADGDRFRIGSLEIEASFKANAAGADEKPEPPEARASSSTKQSADKAVGRSHLRLADTTDAFRPPPARIPDDWAIDLRQPACENEVPALAVNRRLNALERAASQPLLAELFLDDHDMADVKLNPEAAMAIGRSLRLCLELVWQLRAEFDRVDAHLVGKKRSEDNADVRREVENFVRGLLHEDGAALRMADLQQMASYLRGRHIALHDSYTESLNTIVDQFQPDKFIERMEAAGRDQSSLRRLINRVLPAVSSWRFYKGWYDQQQSDGYRAVHQLFEKKLLSVYRHINKARQDEAASGVIAPSGREPLPKKTHEKIKEAVE